MNVRSLVLHSWDLWYIQKSSKELEAHDQLVFCLYFALFTDAWLKMCTICKVSSQIIDKAKLSTNSPSRCFQKRIIDSSWNFTLLMKKNIAWQAIINSHECLQVWQNLKGYHRSSRPWLISYFIVGFGSSQKLRNSSQSHFQQ